MIENKKYLKNLESEIVVGIVIARKIKQTSSLVSSDFSVLKKRREQSKREVEIANNLLSVVSRGILTEAEVEDLLISLKRRGSIIERRLVHFDTLPN